MLIPAFDEAGFLPEGMHDCEMTEVKLRFGSFQGSEQRSVLFKKLEMFVAEARPARLGQWILIDGSFVTSKPNPNEVDLIVTVSVGHNFSADLSPHQYNLVSKRRVQRRYGFDIVVVREETSEYAEAVAFFAEVRHAPELRKGILRNRL
jgi:hypothetical protein